MLLTGVPGIGKTTIVKRVAAFVTGEIRRAGRRVGFELSTFTGHKKVLAHVDVDSRHRVGRYGIDVAALDEIAEEALALDDATDENRNEMPDQIVTWLNRASSKEVKERDEGTR